VAFLNVTYQSSSVIYSSGSNILGDEANVDTQTLIGRVIMSGSGEVTGSFKVSGDISSSTISGIGNVTLYSASVAASITGSSENVTTLSASIYQTDATQSNNIATNTTNIATLTSKTGSYATTGSNTFVGNQIINGALQVSSSATYDIDVTGSIQATTSIRVSGSVGIATIAGNSITVSSGSLAASFSKNVIAHNSSSNTIGIIAGAGTSPFTAVTNASIVISSGSLGAFYYPMQFQAGTSYTDGRVTFVNPLVVSSSVLVSGATNFTELTGSLSDFSSSLNTRSNQSSEQPVTASIEFLNSPIVPALSTA
jgi:hypothetical protein